MYNQQYQQQQQQPQQGFGGNQPYQQQAPAASNGSSLMVQGRLVWVGGSLFTGKKKVNDQNQPVMDQKTGQQVIEYGFGLAVPKDSPLCKQVMDALYKEAYTIYPNGQIPNDFAFKFKDGDGNDHNGKPFSQREGYAGHIVLNCTTQIPLKCFIWQGGNNVLVNDGIKCGDYVNVQLNIVAHPPKGRGKPGLYLNPSAMQLIQPGKEIINAPSGDQLFGQNAPQYAGQVIADQGPQMPNMGGQPPMNNQGYQQTVQPGPAMPQQGYAPQQGYQQQAPAPQADPHYNVLPPQHQPGYQAPQPNQQGGMPMPGPNGYPQR